MRLGYFYRPRYTMPPLTEEEAMGPYYGMNDDELQSYSTQIVPPQELFDLGDMLFGLASPTLSGLLGPEAENPPAVPQTQMPSTMPLGIMLGVPLLISTLSAGASAYHGYKRNRGSAGWAVAWGTLGFLFPIITPIVALVQGYGEPAKK